MNCRIEVLKGDLERFSPNLDFLASLIEVFAPEEISGHFTLCACVSGLRIDFQGAGSLRGWSRQSEVIPRWMFCEEAFRELLVARAQAFVATIVSMAPDVATPEAESREEMLPGWLI